MREKIEALIKDLVQRHDFESEFYLTYCCGENDGDISDWYDSHFDDNIARGFSTGQTALAHEMVIELNNILQGE